MRTKSILFVCCPFKRTKYDSGGLIRAHFLNIQINTSLTHTHTITKGRGLTLGKVLLLSVVMLICREDWTQREREPSKLNMALVLQLYEVCVCVWTWVCESIRRNELEIFVFKLKELDAVLRRWFRSLRNGNTNMWDNIKPLLHTPAPMTFLSWRAGLNTHTHTASIPSSW